MNDEMDVLKDIQKEIIKDNFNRKIEHEQKKFDELQEKWTLNQDFKNQK